MWVSAITPLGLDPVLKDILKSVVHATLDTPRFGIRHSAIAEIKSHQTLVVRLYGRLVADLVDLLNDGLREALAPDEGGPIGLGGEVGADVLEPAVLERRVRHVDGEAVDRQLGLAVDEELDVGPGAHVAELHGARGRAGRRHDVGVRPAVGELFAELDRGLDDGFVETDSLLGAHLDPVRVRVRRGFLPCECFRARCNATSQIWSIRVDRGKTGRKERNKRSFGEDNLLSIPQAMSGSFEMNLGSLTVHSEKWLSYSSWR